MLADRQGVCDEIYLGFAKVATGPFHYLGKQSAPDVEPWGVPGRCTLARDGTGLSVRSSSWGHHWLGRHGHGLLIAARVGDWYVVMLRVNA